MSGASEHRIITELIGHWRLSDDFGASCVFMPAIRTPVFRMKLKREGKKFIIIESRDYDCQHKYYDESVSLSLDFNPIASSSRKQIYDA